MGAAHRAAFVVALGAVVACGFVVSSVGDEPSGTSSSSSSSGSTSSSGGSTSSGGSEVDGPSGKADDADAGTATDAAYDGPCPAACSSCTTTRCNIDCPGPKCTEKTIFCAPGMDCLITCTGTDACKGSDRKYRCPLGKACTFICNGEKACEDAELDGRDASSICVTCSGQGACNNTDCREPPTNCFCGPGECPCNQGNCMDVPACP